MFIREDEKIDEIGFGGLKLIQSSEGFRYGVDAVVLADFAATLATGGRRVFDLGKELFHLYFPIRCLKAS